MTQRQTDIFLRIDLMLPAPAAIMDSAFPFALQIFMYKRYNGLVSQKQQKQWNLSRTHIQYNIDNTENQPIIV